MDEDSLSRDCEPFFESDGEEESTDGKDSEKGNLFHFTAVSSIRLM